MAPPVDDQLPAANDVGIARGIVGEDDAIERKNTTERGIHPKIATIANMAAADRNISCAQRVKGETVARIRSNHDAIQRDIPGGGGIQAITIILTEGAAGHFNNAGTKGVIQEGTVAMGSVISHDFIQHDDPAGVGVQAIRTISVEDAPVHTDEPGTSMIIQGCAVANIANRHDSAAQFDLRGGGGIQAITIILAESAASYSNEAGTSMVIQGCAHAVRVVG